MALNDINVGEGIPLALKRATEEGVFHAPGSGNLDDLEAKPCGLFYDLDAWEGNLEECKRVFGPGFLHAIAFKSNALGPMMQTCVNKGLGAECASMGEVLHAEKCGFSMDTIIFDSPVKTVAEIRYSLKNGIHLNIDNFSELEVIAEQVAQVGSAGVVGIRINPLCGAGAIKALSVSTEDSKFGIPVSFRAELLAAYAKYPWLNSVHVHVGSGGMGCKILVEGIATAVAFAEEVNAAAGKKQVDVLDMGGGFPVNYLGESWTSEKVPTWQEYAEALRERVPQLFDNAYFKRVVTEFGQSLNAKSGWLGSRIEYVKPMGKEQCCLIHFGADSCVRQMYTNEHGRRIEFYAADGSKAEGKELTTVAGPLCFAGDVFARSLEGPKLNRGDCVVLREAGANTLSLFSRHCLRQAPAAYGYRRANGAISEFTTLRPIESMDSCSKYWKPQ
jgi:diaminopimelate decarboxylase